MNKDAKISFRCTKEEKRKLEDMCVKYGCSMPDLILNETIYKKHRRNRRTNRELSIVSNILTEINKIQDKVDVEKSFESIRTEGEKLCLLLKM